MNRNLIQRYTGGFHSNRSTIVLPKYELNNIQKQKEEQSRKKEELDFSDGLNKLCIALLRGTPEPAKPVINKPESIDQKSHEVVEPKPELEGQGCKPSEIAIVSIKDKSTKTPSQLKIDAEKKKIDEKDAELLQEELNKKPERPGERLLKKLVKKVVKKKIPSHIKKKVAKIRDIEAKEHVEVSTNNKILDAIKSAYL